ncbi:hypothetical protein [Listeria sp. PSOL-1]|uniref:hypothetical protein n=1 Tax=Listeria sp. PSOL-1 TaxID=1844999 RepID=UPI0013D03DEC|nr:hypothetical protein [Listeria sp. PSOL-1]
MSTHQETPIEIYHYTIPKKFSIIEMNFHITAVYIFLWICMVVVAVSIGQLSFLQIISATIFFLLSIAVIIIFVSKGYILFFHKSFGLIGFSSQQELVLYKNKIVLYYKEQQFGKELSMEEFNRLKIIYRKKYAVLKSKFYLSKFFAVIPLDVAKEIDNKIRKIKE